jgi:hypothetical protein
MAQHLSGKALIQSLKFKKAKDDPSIAADRKARNDAFARAHVQSYLQKDAEIRAKRATQGVYPQVINAA